MPWFKKTNVSEFFLNEAHPYSKKRTIKIQHVGIAIAVLSFIVLAAGSVLEKRAAKEHEEAQAQKEVKNNMATASNSTSDSSPPAQDGKDGSLSLQSFFGSKGGGSGRQLSASQIISRGSSVSDVLPTGTQIQVRLLGKVESVDANSPIIAVVLQDVLSPVDVPVIPKGSKIIGNGQLDAERERLLAHFHTVVFPEGEQFSVSGLAIMPDGSSGLQGRFSSGSFKRNASQFIGNFIGGIAEGMKDRTAGQIGIPFEPGSLKNGVLNGVADSSLNYAKSSSEKMGQATAKIEIESGLPFVLYLEREFHQ